MIPLPTQDPALLEEHAFYETGNLKHVLPFIKYQSYDLIHKNFNHLYMHKSNFPLASVLLVAVILSMFGVGVKYLLMLRREQHREKLIV